MATSAQEEDSVSNVRSMIEEGQENVKKAKSRRMRRKKSARLKLFKKSLKSFSSAYRMIIGLQLEDPALLQSVEDGLNQIHAESLIKTELNTLKTKLTKSLAAKKYNDAYQIAEELHNLDARKKEFEYIMRTVAQLSIDKP